MRSGPGRHSGLSAACGSADIDTGFCPKLSDLNFGAASKLRRPSTSLCMYHAFCALSLVKLDQDNTDPPSRAS
jgi:hypothetical protein